MSEPVEFPPMGTPNAERRMMDACLKRLGESDEEIMRLRADNARLVGEVESLSKQVENLSTQFVNKDHDIQRHKEALQCAKVALEKSIWQHRCSDGIGGCTAISESCRQDALATINEVLK